MAGKVFGNASEVRSLAKITKMCMDAISENNNRGSTLLSTIEGAESDKPVSYTHLTLPTTPYV